METSKAVAYVIGKIGDGTSTTKAVSFVVGGISPSEVSTSKANIYVIGTPYVSTGRPLVMFIS